MTFFLSHTQWCSGLLLALYTGVLEKLGGPYVKPELNSGQLCAIQVPSPLYYLSVLEGMKETGCIGGGKCTLVQSVFTFLDGNSIMFSCRGHFGLGERVTLSSLGLSIYKTAIIPSVSWDYYQNLIQKAGKVPALYTGDPGSI